ncbi:hypothetical protein K6119_03530 [Paracrocinitomix mangrovi]|uniref:hypothetical protein n=1 Tax=Paracrocinitomix mangrovi TaxID=2862509 RepID=UPI001C8EAE84|nr:hypothetical protein [Paracrocinitomix mangrovi]UKN02582.1 hypothetical protein K6119_03530 [Paracrocinitomix mangrovi]
MKHLLLLSAIIITAATFAQNITAFADQNNRLYKFDSGSLTQIYYQPTKELHIDNQYVCFVDSKGDIYVNFYGEQTMVAQTHTKIFDTDNLLLVQTASVLRVFDRGVKHILTSNAISFGVGDSLVVWQDNIGGYLKYYYEDEVHEVAMVVGNYPLMPDHVGENTFVYRDNAGNVSVFWHGKFYPIYSWNSLGVIRAGQDVVAFNDPQSGTFSAFDNGYVVDVEPQHALNFRCGDNFIYYKDQSETHKIFREEETMELGFDLQNIDVQDSVVIFRDVGIMKIWYQMEIYQIFNTKVGNYQVDGGIVAYTNQWGGVSAFVRGKEVEITRSKVQSFELHGNTILMKMGASTYWVWWNDKIHEF